MCPASASQSPTETRMRAAHLIPSVHFLSMTAMVWCEILDQIIMYKKEKNLNKLDNLIYLKHTINKICFSRNNN